MVMAKFSEKAFIKQAGILVMAGIICRIIGVLYRSPLTIIIGNEGNGYYSAAYNIYSTILLISSYSIPSALSKEMSRYMALHEYKNACKFFKGTMYYVLFVGSICSILMYYFAPYLIDGSGSKVLRLFCPCVVFSGILGVLRGYFQSFNTMIQTSISQIIEQLANAIMSITIAYCFINMLDNSNATNKAINGAMGSALGTGIGIFVSLLFLIYIYTKSKYILIKKSKKDTNNVIRYKQIFRIIILTVTPIVFSTFIYNVGITLNQMLFIKISLFKGSVVTDLYKEYGCLSGKAMVIQNIPIAIVSAISSSLIPQISNEYAMMRMDELKQKIKTSLEMALFIILPSSIGIFILAKPILQVLFPGDELLKETIILLKMLSCSITFSSISTLYNGVLQGIGKVNIPVKNALISLIIQTVTLSMCLLFSSSGIFAVAGVSFLYSCSMFLLNSKSIKKRLSFYINWKKDVLPYLFSSLLMGVTLFIVERLLNRIVTFVFFKLLLCILIGIFVYFIILIKIKKIDIKNKYQYH